MKDPPRQDHLRVICKKELLGLELEPPVFVRLVVHGYSVGLLRSSSVSGSQRSL